ncbi:MAG: flagellin [Lawsonibacter sp.]|nr:flagellin [Lawsonibacter sp.]
MSLRVTTNGTLYAYKSNLMRSRTKLNSASEKVLTNRNFNSYAEDPASASQAFQLRRSLWNTTSQITNNNAVANKYNTAWKAVDAVVNDLGSDLANVSALRGLTDSTASGRQSLGQTLKSSADAVLKTMNTTYGDNFVFAGADGLNVPFTWGTDGTLQYRGVNVDVQTGSADYESLKLMAGETTYVDIGLGLEEANDGSMIESSAFNSALSGLTYLGYGMDADGDPKNICSIMKQLGNILSSCDATTGNYASDTDEETANRLTDKLQTALSNLSVQHTELDSQATFLDTNVTRLKSTQDTLNEQITEIEDCDPADAIKDMSWAQYCYNAALKVGNSLLSQSLLDYMD